MTARWARRRRSPCRPCHSGARTRPAAPARNRARGADISPAGPEDVADLARLALGRVDLEQERPVLRVDHEPRERRAGALPRTLLAVGAGAGRNDAGGAELLAADR